MKRKNGSLWRDDRPTKRLLFLWQIFFTFAFKFNIMTDGQFIKNDKGEVIGVFLTIEKYQELLEDLDDIKTFRKAKAKNEPTIPLREAIALRNNALHRRSVKKRSKTTP